MRHKTEDAQFSFCFLHRRYANYQCDRIVALQLSRKAPMFQIHNSARYIIQQRLESTSQSTWVVVSCRLKKIRLSRRWMWSRVAWCIRTNVTGAILTADNGRNSFSKTLVRVYQTTRRYIQEGQYNFTILTRHIFQQTSQNYFRLPTCAIRQHGSKLFINL